MSVDATLLATWHRRISEEGFVIVPSVFSSVELDEFIAGLDAALHQRDETEGPIRDRTGTVYAGRNLLSLFERARTLWRRSPLLELLHEVLGPDVGLVRGLFFDKPPERTWSLPWHKDMTLAVRDHAVISPAFSKPTLKAGVPHVEGSVEVLEAMLTLRIHLDDVTIDNGPLQVLPRSHHTGKVPVAPDDSVRTILVQRGDVLAIRPLVAHRSISSSPGTTRHRRVLHLEFAGRRELPDSVAWHDFVSAT
jgi:hypothetical protein